MNHVPKVEPHFDDGRIVANGKKQKLLKYIGRKVSKWKVSLHLSSEFTCSTEFKMDKKAWFFQHDW